jgi:hypothetical protein
MDPIWTPSSTEIRKLTQKETLFTAWLYNKAIQRETLHDYRLLQTQIEKKKLEKQLILEKEALMKAMLINQSIKPKVETRINNDGSVCKFLY